MPYDGGFQPPAPQQQQQQPKRSMIGGLLERLGFGGAPAAPEMGAVQPAQAPMMGMPDEIDERNMPRQGEDAIDAADKAAEREARERIANGIMGGTQQQPGSPANNWQLKRMGLSSRQIEFLRMSGGTK